MNIIKSNNDIYIRLTNERWNHILDEHTELEGLKDEILRTVSKPEFIFEGKYGEFLAVNEIVSRKFFSSDLQRIK